MSDIQKKTKEAMAKAVAFLKSDLTKIRTGRASPAILEDIKVDYYGTMTPISQVANLSVPDARTIVVNAWEASMLPVVEKAIRSSGLNLNPLNDGKVLKVPLPPLSEERRKELVKTIKSKGEDTKVAVRNFRRDANEEVKKLEKDKVLTTDQVKKESDMIQKLTDEHIKEVDGIVSAKEKEVMTV